MKNNLTTTLIIGLALVTSTSLQAMTKARSLTQAAVTYARNNKLKTTGIIIGGAIALDVLQTGVRYMYHLRPGHQALLKASSDKHILAQKKCSDAGTEYHKKFTPESLTAFQEAGNKVDRCWKEYEELLLFHPSKASFILRAYDRIVKTIRG